MTREEFIERYGSVYEHSPWVAEQAWDGGATEGDGLAEALRIAVERAGIERQLLLLRAHPDLVNKVAVLSDQSAHEQASAGLDGCSEEEAREFATLNTHYRNRFGFPFIIAVRGLDRAAILAEFRRRVELPHDDELRTALDEVHRIAALRLAALQAPSDPPSHESVAEDTLRSLVLRALSRHGADAANAAAIADTVCAAQRDGSESHGAFRVPGYVAALKSGRLNGRAAPRVIAGPPGAVVIEGDGGSASMGYAIGLPELLERVRSQGVAVLALRNSLHFAALWHEVEWLAERGLAAFACTANFPYLAPHGGHRPFMGTNPVAFAYPRAGDPVVFDFATSAMARGDIMIAKRDGDTVPPGVGLDKDGAPTTDPGAILSGAQLPFGGHKGSALALMVELLAGGVVGDLFSDEAAAEADESGVPPGGVFVLALDPDAIGGAGRKAAAEAFLTRFAGEPGVRLPGTRRHARRKQGGPLQVPSALLQTLRELAGEA